MLTNPLLRPSAFAVAFYQAAIQKPDHRLCPAIGSAIERNRGLVRERSANANVSFRTAQKLKREGAL